MRVLLEWTRILFITVICLTLCPAVASMAYAIESEFIWKNVSSDIRDSDLRTVAVSPDNAEIVYAGSSSAVFKTVNCGKSWTEVLSFRGTGNTIKTIAINPVDTKVIYAGTKDGLYKSSDQGTSWKKIFSGIEDLKRSILSIAVNPADSNVIFIGTGAGIFRTDTGGINWEKGDNIPSSAEVSVIAIDPSRPQYVYAVTDRGLYKSINSGKAWAMIFDARTIKDDSTEEDSSSTGDESAEADEIKTEIKGIAINSSDPGIVYAFTPEGLVVTEDGGLTWKALSSSGLISRNVQNIVADTEESGSVYAATDRGVFRYSRVSGNWTELYNGLTSVDIRFISITPGFKNRPAALWAATKNGIFKTITPVQESLSGNNAVRTDNILPGFDNEPPVNEILKAAIRYAEVSPEKINGWRKAAAKRAWLPDLKVEYERDKDWQSSNYFYSTTTQKYKDDDITEGKDWGWSISVTWELGDLIWNNAQTSIDTRSKLMVQLRDDVLNEVTRLYFERRRLQIDMLSSPATRPKERMEKELRLQELTADIDALTGFYLSNKLGRM